MSKVHCATKPEELVRLYPHYNVVDAEECKCIKFESGLRPEIKQFIGYQEIHEFPVLFYKCHIYDEDSHERFTYYQSSSDKKNGNQNHSKPYIVLDGVIHSFISVDCMKILNLMVSFMNGNIVIDILARESVNTSMVCLQCHLTIYGKNFGVNLVFLPLSHLDIIMGMNWLQFNHIHINYYDKTVLFPEYVEEEVSKFIFVNQLEGLMKDEAQVFTMVAYLKLETKAIIDELPVVCQFPDVFPDDIINLPPKREVEFSIE
ncbi:uncharacterized protein LOC127136584 [Lathyrus oleraceus]|uniref:uncharacterized protein LOC127136584 n=1 Tax=Pisum sativum TaxID=3888 RepID=UPI0021CEC699|nr:uncharacterized protein LOC127136584 [Pisum sativum]